MSDDRRRALRCGKQTQNGAAAWANTSGFAPCVLEAGHREPCYSGPAPRKVA